MKHFKIGTFEALYTSKIETAIDTIADSTKAILGKEKTFLPAGTRDIMVAKMNEMIDFATANLGLEDDDKIIMIDTIKSYICEEFAFLPDKEYRTLARLRKQLRDHAHGDNPTVEGFTILRDRILAYFNSGIIGNDSKYNLLAMYDYFVEFYV